MRPGLLGGRTCQGFLSREFERLDGTPTSQSYQGLKMRAGQSCSEETIHGPRPSSPGECSGKRMMVILEVDPSVDCSCPCGSCQKESKIWLEIPPGVQFAGDLLKEIEHTYHLTGEHHLFFMDFFLPPTTLVRSVMESFNSGALKIMPLRAFEGPESRSFLPPALIKQQAPEEDKGSKSTPYPAAASMKRRITEIKEKPEPGHSQPKKAEITANLDSSSKIPTAEFRPDILTPKSKKTNDNCEIGKEDPRPQATARRRGSSFYTTPISKLILSLFLHAIFELLSSESDQEN